MLQTTTNIREQVSALFETLHAHQGYISAASQAAIRRASNGDTSINADQVVSSLIRNLTIDLQKHDKCISANVGSACFWFNPHEYLDDFKIVSLDQQEMIKKIVEAKIQESQQVMTEKLRNLELKFVEFSTNFNQKDQKTIKPKSLDKSMTKKRQRKGKDSAQNNVIWEFNPFEDLQESSQMSTELIKKSQNSLRISTRWTGPAFNSGHEMTLCYPNQAQLEKIQTLDATQLPKFALDVISHCKGKLISEFGEEVHWDFRFNVNGRSNFYSGEYRMAQTPIYQVKRPIKKIVFSLMDSTWIQSCQIFDRNNHPFFNYGAKPSNSVEINLDEGEMIIGIAAVEDPEHKGCLSDIQFMLGKVVKE